MFLEETPDSCFELSSYREVGFLILPEGIPDGPRFPPGPMPAGHEIESLLTEEGDHDINIVDFHFIDALGPQAVGGIAESGQGGHSGLGDPTCGGKACRTRVNPVGAESAGHGLGHGRAAAVADADEEEGEGGHLAILTCIMPFLGG